MTALTSLRELAQAATPGPWRLVNEYQVWEQIPPQPNTRHVYVAGSTHSRDAAFIAAANPALLLRLIDVAEKAQAVLWQIEQPGARLSPGAVIDVDALRTSLSELEKE